MVVLCQICVLQNILPGFNLTFYPPHMVFHRWKNFDFDRVLFVIFPFMDHAFGVVRKRCVACWVVVKNLYPPLDSSNTTAGERGRNTSLLPGGHWSPGFLRGLHGHCKGQTSLPPSENEPYFPDILEVKRKQRNSLHCCSLHFKVSSQSAYSLLLLELYYLAFLYNI